MVALKPEVALTQHLMLIEWMQVQPRVRNLTDYPDWYYSYTLPEESGGPWSEIAVRHLDGREFKINSGLYTRTTRKVPFNMTFEYEVLIELHERYPEEFDIPAEPDQYSLQLMREWPAQQFIDLALESLLNEDLMGFRKAVLGAAEKMGVKLAVIKLVE